MSALIGNLTNIKTGKLDANAASSDGKYPFFTCAQESLAIDRYAYDCDAILVAGNGDLNVKHYKGKFEAYQRTYIIQVADESKLDSRYLYYFMSKYVDKLRELSIGGVIKYIKLGMLTDAEIPLPPLAEQKRIAAILDKADAIRRKRQAAIKLADDFLRATFLDMFSDIRPKMMTIGELLDDEILLLHKDGNHGSLYPRADEFVQDGIPFISAKAFAATGYIDDSLVPRLSTQKAQKLKIGWIKDGDVLLAHNATVGPVFLYRGQYEKALIGTSLTAFRPDREKLTSEFLFGAMSSSFFQNQLTSVMKQTTRNQVPITAQRNLVIKLLPFERQIEYSNIFIKFSALKKYVSIITATDQKLFNSLTQRAFRGEL